MAENKSITKVLINIKNAYKKREDAALALSERYALLARKTARDSQGLSQGEGQFWTNRTSLATKSIFGYSFKDKNEVGWGLAHAMEYGEYLELAHGRRHAILEPTVKILTPWFFDDLRKIYADT